MKRTRPDKTGPDRAARRPSAVRPKEEIASWCDRFAQECRRRGIRVTAQRTAVFQAVAEDLSHPTAEAVHRRILSQIGTMSLATVYRTLEFLVGARLLRRVSTAESVARFDANLAPHQHLVCRSCGCLQDWESASLRRIRIPRTSPAGFRAESLDIRIIGLCAACSTIPDDVSNSQP